MRYLQYAIAARNPQLVTCLVYRPWVFPQCVPRVWLPSCWCRYRRIHVHHAFWRERDAFDSYISRSSTPFWDFYRSTPDCGSISMSINTCYRMSGSPGVVCPVAVPLRPIRQSLLSVESLGPHGTKSLLGTSTSLLPLTPKRCLLNAWTKHIASDIRDNGHPQATSGPRERALACWTWIYLRQKGQRRPADPLLWRQIVKSGHSVMKSPDVMKQYYWAPLMADQPYVVAGRGVEVGV